MKQTIPIAVLLLLQAVPSRSAVDPSLQIFLNNPADIRLAAGEIKSGTRYVLQVYQNWMQLEVKDRQTYLRRAVSPPLRQRSMVSPAGNFTLHWDESGTDAVPLEDQDNNNIPDYIDSAAVIFDRVWRMEVDTLGFSAPPGEDGQTVASYPVYFSQLPYYGLTWYSGVDIPSLPGVNYTSYMEVENDFSGFPTDSLDGLRVTAAHEFHHAIQFGYNVREEDFFFYEMTSTWMEDVVYPDINDYYQYLTSFFGSFSNTSFNFYNSFTLFPYANSLYLKMLARQFGPSIVRTIWDRMKSENSIAALTQVLSSFPYQSSWIASLNEYAIWLYYCGERAMAGLYFPEAAEFPDMAIKSGDRFTIDREVSRAVPLNAYASRYLMVYGLMDQSITFNIGVPGVPQAGFCLLRAGSNSGFIPVNSMYTSAADPADTLVLVLTNAEDKDTVFSVLAGKRDFDEVVYGPNPVVRSAGHRWVEFRNLPAQTELLIFTAAGKKVVGLKNDDRVNLQWDLRNEDGQEVAAGVYLFVLRGDRLMETGKIAVIR